MIHQTQEVQYSPPRHVGATTTTVLTLCAFPLAAGFLGLVTGISAFGEPFAFFRLRDFVVFAGVPVAMVALGVIWFWLALKHRVPTIVMVLVLIWFAMAILGAVQEVLAYLREPWNV